MRCLWTLRLLAAAAASALRGASGLPAPAYLSTGVAVGEEMPALAYAGAGTFQNGVYTTMYDSFGEPLHSFWPLNGLWNGAELAPWRSTNTFRTNWKPAVKRREIPTQRAPIDLRMGYRCRWEVRPGDAAVSVPVGTACRSAQEQPQERPPTHNPTRDETAIPESDASASRYTTSLPPRLGEAAQLVMQHQGGEVGDQQADEPVSAEDELDAQNTKDSPGTHSRHRRQVSRLGRRGASSSAAAAAASASSGPWGSSASAAAASAASGGRRSPTYGRRRPAYGYGRGVYGQRPAYGRPMPGPFYG
ncbi:uncharacterized protein LOC126188075 [Schistocerca cancellata]|uniref:uncharacterized protein LOC126188075 n=1 Tax=Schistocerca cancellata TaxID=274614 RepID=UPI002119AB98|nr:uncharacterized protein LOC126188075 [Schistocerca cancellata]